MKVKPKTAEELKGIKGGHCVDLWLTLGKAYDATPELSLAANNTWGEDRPGYRLSDDSGFQQVWSADYFDVVEE